MNARKLKPPPREPVLTDDQLRFIESLALLYERIGVPRIGARMFGLLLVAEEPLSAEQMADLLGVSRASVSTNLRLLLGTALCEQVGVPGERRHFYAIAEDAFTGQLESQMGLLKKLQVLCRQGARKTPPSHSRARRRLQQAADYCAFMEDEIAGVIRRWRTRRSR